MQTTRFTFNDDAQAALVRAFETRTIDTSAFHHREHVQLTWALLRSMPLDAAIDELRAGLKHIATANGKAERYHETMTVFYAAQIHARMAGRNDESWEAFAERNGDLLGPPKNFLARYYREATLKSDAARLGYVPPDIAAK